MKMRLSQWIAVGLTLAMAGDPVTAATSSEQRATRQGSTAFTHRSLLVAQSLFASQALAPEPVFEIAESLVSKPGVHAKQGVAEAVEGRASDQPAVSTTVGRIVAGTSALTGMLAAYLAYGVSAVEAADGITRAADAFHTFGFAHDLTAILGFAVTGLLLLALGSIHKRLPSRLQKLWRWLNSPLNFFSMTQLVVLMLMFRTVIDLSSTMLGIPPENIHDWVWDPLESTCRHASLSIL